MLARAGPNQEADERRVEHHPRHEREHPDDDRLSHGAIRQSLIIISAICFQIGAASSEPKRSVCVLLRLVEDDHHRELRILRGHEAHEGRDHVGAVAPAVGQRDLRGPGLAGDLPR